MARESNPEKLPTQRNESARRPSDTGLRRRTNENFQRPLPLKPPPDPFGEHIITVNPSGSSPRPKPGTLGRRFRPTPSIMSLHQWEYQHAGEAAGTHHNV